MQKKLQLEYVFNNISIAILWKMIATPQGLSEWFSENCDRTDDKFVFSWGNDVETATVLDEEEYRFLRLRWEESGEDEYFQFTIDISQFTQEVTLQITDFCDEDELEDTELLWNKQIADLKKCAGI